MREYKETFLALIQENKGILIKICNAYCSQKADKDDLAQEIVFNLWKSFETYRPHYKVSTWMYQIALNVAISFYRKEKRNLNFTAYSEELIVFENDGDNSLEKEGNLQILETFIQELNEIDKSIMLLYLDDKSYKEIAICLGITETNIATKISRIKTNLKSKFSKR
ncbi:MAG: sigma-70 family RNA polymerase sigma factor [Bacteroidota bacterium]